MPVWRFGAAQSSGVIIDYDTSRYDTLNRIYRAVIEHFFTSCSASRSFISFSSPRGNQLG